MTIDKPWNEMTREEKLDFLWDCHQTWDKRLQEVADMEEVWEEEFLLFGRIRLGKKVRRKKWLPRKTD